MSGPVLVSFPVENRATAQSLGRTLVERGWASGVEISGPFQRLATHNGTYVEQEVWRLVCRTTADRRAEVEEFGLRVINRHGVEVNVIPLLPAANERPVDS